MRELFMPHFMDRRPYNVWQEKQDGAQDWALAQARRLLANHQPQVLDTKLDKELQRIIAAAEKV